MGKAAQASDAQLPLLPPTKGSADSPRDRAWVTRGDAGTVPTVPGSRWPGHERPCYYLECPRK